MGRHYEAEQTDPEHSERWVTFNPCGGALGFCLKLFAFLLLICIPISMLLMGWSYWEECPVEILPLLLVIGGLITVIQYPLEFTVCCIPGGNNQLTCLKLCLAFIQNIFRFAGIIWSITAAVIVYGLYDRVSYDELDSASYCHPVLYTFAFWMVTLFIGVYVVGIIAMCCVLATSICCSKN